MSEQDFKLRSLTGDAFKQEPFWKEIAGNLRDAVFPRKLPPLVLTSKPVAVVDPMKVKRNPVSTAVSVIAHIVVIAILGALLINRIVPKISNKPLNATDVDVKPYLPFEQKKVTMGGGGGGGDHDLTEASKGRLPKFSKQQITPPQIIRNDNPKLAVTPTVIMPQNVKLPDSNLPNFGVPNSSQVALASNGTGSGGGMGNGRGGGLGNGSGGGIGNGSGGGYGGGVYHPGGGVSRPVLLYSPDPDFSDEARRAKYQGVCVVRLIIDAQGHPQNVHTIRKLGMGLDEKAEEAVRQYRFKPSYKDGKPVPVEIDVEVNFHIY